MKNSSSAAKTTVHAIFTTILLQTTEVTDTDIFHSYKNIKSILKRIQCNVPLVAFDDTIESLVERSWCEVATPVMVVPVSIGVEVTGQHWIASRNVLNCIRQLTDSSSTLAQGTEIVGKCSEMDLQQTRCSAIVERLHCRMCYSFCQKCKTETGRQYFTDIIGLSSTTEI